MSFQSMESGSAPFVTRHEVMAGGHDRPPRLLPDQIEESLRGAFNRLAGFGLMVLAVACWAALLSWSIEDPTLTRPLSGNEAHLLGNWLGAPGAAVSDLLLRGLGLASAFALLPFVVWGVDLMVRQRIAQWRVKLVLWVVGTLSLSGAMAALPLIQAWRIPHGFGGLAGDFAYALAGGLMGHVNAAHGATAAGLLLLAGGAAALFAAVGAGRDELAMIWHGDNWRRHRQRPNGAKPAGGQPPPNGAPVPPSFRDHAADLMGHRPGHPERGNSASIEPPRGRFWQGAERAPAVAVARPHFAHPQGGSPEADQWPASGYAFAAADDRSDLLGGTVLELESRAIAARFAPNTGAARKPDRGGTPAMAMPTPDDSGLPPPPDLGPPPAPEPPQAPAAAARGFLRGWTARTAQPSAATGYRAPALAMLKRMAPPKPGPEFSQNVQRGVAKLLEDVLLDFGVKGQIMGVKPGPVVTLYELEPARGVKSSRIVGLSDDIARSMSATSARVAGIPGRNVIGIELPNMRRETVYLRELLESQSYANPGIALPLVLGKGIGGEPIVADLARMPHVLVAGTTGSGKSVGINAMILSLLFRLGPDQCRFLMIDPKMLELSVYNGIPHLLAPVITDAHKAVSALEWVVREMEERYKRMAQLAVRNIEVFNARVRQATEQGETLSRTVQTGFDPRSGAPVYETERMAPEPMPYIVVIVDEMADLMLTAGKEIEGAVQRLAQMARAAGIHLIMATQRPSVDVVTGTIKANFPTRISFKVASKIDSRTILGEQGAEQLLGAGDMLLSSGSGQIVRVHGPFVSDEEVEQVAAYLRTQGEPAYVDGIGDDAEGPDSAAAEDARDSDDAYDKAVAVVLRDRKASTSYIQRRLGVGYNKAASLMERMEQEGLVSSANSVGKRNILVGETGGRAA